MSRRPILVALIVNPVPSSRVSRDTVLGVQRSQWCLLVSLNNGNTWITGVWLSNALRVGPRRAEGAHGLDTGGLANNARARSLQWRS